MPSRACLTTTKVAPQIRATKANAESARQRAGTFFPGRDSVARGVKRGVKLRCRSPALHRFPNRREAKPAATERAADLVRGRQAGTIPEKNALRLPDRPCQWKSQVGQATEGCWRQWKRS